MPIDEPVSTATELFMAKRVLDAHWTRALALVAEVASVMLQKR
ncbi:hypothetical protein [Micromonospora sp. NPDC047187]